MYVKITDINKDKAQVILFKRLFLTKCFMKKMVLQLLFKSLYFYQYPVYFLEW